MKNKNMKIFSIAINTIVIIVMAIIIKNNQKDHIMMYLDLILLILVYLIGNKVVCKENLKQRLILHTINVLIISTIVTLDTTGLSIILFLVQVGEAVINTSFIIGICLAIANYIFYLIILCVNRGTLNVYEISIITINFTFIYILTSGIRHEIIERGKVQLIAKELEAKTEQLERAYTKLQELYEEKEEVILFKEKNRIAGEIHDTVGHILTTVVIELEASKRLIKRDSDLALEKLNLAKQQVKNGLDDIRESVRAFKEGEDLINFIDLLKAFIREVEKNSEVTIEYSFSDIPRIDKRIENIIYRSLQEGITNGIRHGYSKRFKIMLNCEDKIIKFIIKDTGKGFKEIKLGFGLYNMKSKVEDTGGIFKIHSVVDEGVTICIEIPVVEGK
jgi:signal transduction histidine kinase